jgi:hypothetical protein
MMEVLTMATDYVLRSAIIHRKEDIDTLARRIGTDASVLHDFVAGKAELSAESTAKLIEVLWKGAAVYDASTDKIFPAKPLNYAAYEGPVRE